MTGRDQPFLGSEAIAGGILGRRALQSRHQRIYRDVYMSESAELTAEARAVAA